MILLNDTTVNWQSPKTDFEKHVARQIEKIRSRKFPLAIVYTEARMKKMGRSRRGRIEYPAPHGMLNTTILDTDNGAQKITYCESFSTDPKTEQKTYRPHNTVYHITLPLKKTQIELAWYLLYVCQYVTFKDEEFGIDKQNIYRLFDPIGEGTQNFEKELETLEFKALVLRDMPITVLRKLAASIGCSKVNEEDEKPLRYKVLSILNSDSDKKKFFLENSLTFKPNVELRSNIQRSIDAKVIEFNLGESKWVWVNNKAGAIIEAICNVSDRAQKFEDLCEHMEQNNQSYKRMLTKLRVSEKQENEADEIPPEEIDPIKNESSNIIKPKLNSAPNKKK